MPVKRDESGRRSVEAEVEVQGTPEQVWDAIASGPGISSWFVPTEVDGRPGGKAISHFGPGDSMDSVGTITEWDPPRRFVATTTEGPGEVATEWTVEARAGGTCRVRVVHSWFASSEDWDGEFEGHQAGWREFFRILRLYLAHFAGQPCASFQSMSMTPAEPATAWSTLVDGLGFVDAREGQEVRSSAEAPTLAGRVEQAGSPQHPMLLLHLQAPGAGIASMFALAMGGPTCVFVRCFFYGHSARSTADREESRWQQWLGARFSQPTGAAGVSQEA